MLLLHPVSMLMTSKMTANARLGDLNIIALTLGTLG